MENLAGHASQCRAAAPLPPQFIGHYTSLLAFSLPTYPHFGSLASLFPAAWTSGLISVCVFAHLLWPLYSLQYRAWFGVACHGMVKHGEVWRGVVWWGMGQPKQHCVV